MEEEPARAHKWSRDLKEDEHGTDGDCEILLPEGYVVVGESDHVVK